MSTPDQHSNRHDTAHADALSASETVTAATAASATAASIDSVPDASTPIMPVPMPMPLALALSQPHSSASISPPPVGPQPRSWVCQTLRSLDAIAFDVDSTASMDEGIDLLAEHMGKGEEVKRLTDTAMNGQVAFEDALNARLNLLRPSRSDVSRLLASHPPRLTPGFKELVSWLLDRGVKVFLVSGGFRCLIEPLRVELGLDADSVYANDIYWDTDSGEYAGFNTQAFTARSGGKARALQHIISTLTSSALSSSSASSSRSVPCESTTTSRPDDPSTSTSISSPTPIRIGMVGDGATDLESMPIASIMIGFGGIVRRDIVKKHAHAFINEWKQLRALMEDDENIKEV